jgi:PiT family inorganic phosphate transporter
MSLIADYGYVLLVLACLFGFFMAWGVGANDVANAMGTSVGSKALTIKQAICIAMVFEFAGAYLAGGEVTETIKSGIVDASMISPALMVLGMMSALLAAGSWLLIASMKGWPVSTTHSIVGAVIGFAAVGVSMDAVNWAGVRPIVASWVVTPVLSGFVAFGLFVSVQKLIIDTDEPFKNAKRFVPLYMFATGFMVALMTVSKGLKHVGLSLSSGESMLLALGVGVAVMLLGIALLSRIQIDVEADKDFHYASVEKVFAVLMIFTACSMAFAHGSNDVANAVGPLAAIVDVIQSGGAAEIGAKTSVPGWVLLLGAVGIVIGLATYGYKVIATIGKRITELTPSRGFAAELATAATVVGASAMGLPVSTTHTLVGAVLGVGLARGIGALNLGMIGKIFMSWLITLPVGAGLSIVFFFILRGIFGSA